jgi:hypothetical protein
MALSMLGLRVRVLGNRHPRDQNVRDQASASREPPVCYREEFRAPGRRTKVPEEGTRGPQVTAMEISDFGGCRRGRDCRLEAPGWMRTDRCAFRPCGVVGLSRSRMRPLRRRWSSRARVDPLPEAECLQLEAGSCHAGSRDGLR